MSTERQPLISVIVPMHNSEKTIATCVRSILAVDYPSFEVLVIDDGSTDGTTAALEEFIGDRRLLPHDLPQGGPSRARNAAVSRARGEYVAFTDADCVVRRDWLSELLKGFDPALKLGKVAGVGGDQEVPADDAPFARLLGGFMKALGLVADYVKESGDSIRPTTHNPSCNAMYRKDILVKAGGFREDLWPGEDVELDHRLHRSGHTLVYNPKAVVGHYRADTLRKFMRMMHRYGHVQALLVKDYGFFRRIHYVPPLTLCGLLLLLLAALTSSWYALLMLLGASLAAGCYFFSKTGRSSGLTVRYIGLFWVAIISWNCGFLKGLLAERA